MAFADLIARVDRVAQRVLGSVTTTYVSSIGTATPVGIFDRNYVLIDPAHAGAEQIGPMIFFRLADLPLHPDDEPLGFPLITINTIVYKVRERKMDGDQGQSIMLLLHVV